MSIIRCTVCDELFDAKEQVEAQYDPAVCEDCIYEDRRLETGASEETQSQAQTVGASRLVGNSDKPISKGLGEI